MGTSKRRVLHFTGKRRITARRIRRQFRLAGTEGTTSPEEDPETDRVNVTHGSWSGTEGETSFQHDKQKRRGGQPQNSSYTPAVGVTQEGKDKACDVEFLWSHCSDAERAEKSRWLAHIATLFVGAQTPLRQRLVDKPAACNSMGPRIASGIPPGWPRLIKFRSCLPRSICSITWSSRCRNRALEWR